MKVLVFSGLGEIQKKSAIIKVKRQFPEEAVTYLDLKHATNDDLELALASNSLFNIGSRLVIVQNAPDNLDLERLQYSNSDLTMLVVPVSSKPATTLISSAKKIGAKVLMFEGEKELSAFPFLDSLIEQKTQALVELDKLLVEYGGMYVLSMIYYLLRRNFLPLPSSMFARKKIEQQRRRYQLVDWLKFYQITLTIDYAIKKGVMSEKLGLIYLVQQFFNVGSENID